MWVCMAALCVCLYYALRIFEDCPVVFKDQSVVDIAIDQSNYDVNLLFVRNCSMGVAIITL